MVRFFECHPVSYDARTDEVSVRGLVLLGGQYGDDGTRELVPQIACEEDRIEGGQPLPTVAISQTVLPS